MAKAGGQRPPSTPVELQIRPASVSDCEAVACIYNQGIEDRQATFETRLRSPVEIRDWLADGDDLPLLVAVGEKEICGWARLMPYSERSAYAGVNEASVYVERAARGRGVGTALLRRLESEADRRGRWKLLGKAFAGNAASLALVERCGWRQVGVHRRHARLDGDWRDVVVVERLLGAAG
jgi:L-amino acid N-acyltransferase YncA